MTKNPKSVKILLFIGQICLILPILSFVLIPLVSLANQDKIDQLNGEIAEKQQKIHKLDREIARQKEALNSVSGKANNLQSTIASLEATKKKIENDINKTETEISRAELTIQRLALEIGEKETLIQKNSEGLSESIRRINSLENISTIEKFLGYETISDFWIDFELTEKLQKKMHTEIQELLALNNQLKEKESEKLSEKNNLTQHKKELSGEKEVALITTKEKQTLLNQTKNEEAEYQRILNQKISEKKKFEEELLEIGNAIKRSNLREIEEELGDAFFALFNIARFLKIDPVKSIERGRRKFEQRFRLVQKMLKKDGKNPKDLSQEELDYYWKSAKNKIEGS